MLDGRIYRAAFVPLLFAIAIAGFSLTARPRPYTSTLAPDAFDGARALADTQGLAKRFPDRRPGSPDDRALATYVARALAGLGEAAGGGFSVHSHDFKAQTIDGERRLTTVVAERPGSTAGAPIVILAHRDAAGRGSEAELSGTATLLELARVFAASATQRTIILVSTSGGSGGNAGAADFAAHMKGSVDAALVLGDLAGGHPRKPFVLPFSADSGSAPVRLQRTVSQALALEVGTDPGAPSVLDQLAHLTFPFTVNEQGPLNASGLPAVLVQVSGERGPAAGEPVVAARLANFGRGVLAAIYALDGAPPVSRGPQTGLLVQRQVIPRWALRLLLLALLLPVALVAIDALARLRRRREPAGRWLAWTLACALPFLLCALFAMILGSLGVMRAAPAEPVLARALPFDASAKEAVLAVVLVLVLAWLGWPALVRRLGLRARPSSDAAGVSMLLVLLGVTVLTWIVNPTTTLLLIPALHLWLLVISPELRPRRVVALLVVALGLVPLILLIAFYARQLGLGPGAVAEDAVLLLAGGRVGLLGALLWSVAFGCLAAAVLMALTPLEGRPTGKGFKGGGVEGMGTPAVRGPVSYAGPGSLGGTESALRR